MEIVPGAPGKPAKSRGRPSETRRVEIGDAIVAATMDAFIQHGMAFSIDDVAKTAGISKQAIYRRWTGKKALLVHSVEHEIEQSVRIATESLPTDPLAALQEAAWRSLNTDRGRHTRMTVRIQMEALADEELAQKLFIWSRRALRIFTDQLAKIVDGDDAAFELAKILQDLLTGVGAMLGWKKASPKAMREAFEARWFAFLAVLEASKKPAGNPGAS